MSQEVMNSLDFLFGLVGIWILCHIYSDLKPCEKYGTKLTTLGGWVVGGLTFFATLDFIKILDYFSKNW